MINCRVGVFGGTFDPPHVAHLEIASEVKDTGLVDKVLMVPCFRHVFDKKPVSFYHRIQMCRQLVNGVDFIEVSDIEKKMETPGRSLALIEALEGLYPTCTFRLVLGADIYLEKDKWHRFDLIEQKASPIYFARKGVSVAKEGWLRAPTDVSSSEIRERLQRHESTAGLTTEAVLAYIVEHQLYGV